MFTKPDLQKIKKSNSEKRKIDTIRKIWGKINPTR
jgi:hypothetical protein